ncbi:MAG: sensor histidine kinase [Bacteroidales bacterium]|nr:sensor histidine kinase [Bacteroidales bacterium]
MTNPKIATIIHGFALLHVAAAVLCRLGNINDELILTSLTIFLIVILCLKYRQSVEFSSVVVIIANIVGYLMGKGIALLVHLFIEHSLLSPAIATFATTEILGWGLVLFMKQYSSRYGTEHKATSQEITWLVVAIAAILVIRLIIRMFSSTMFDGGSMMESIVSFLDNSIVLLLMVGTTIIFIGYRRKRKASMSTPARIGTTVLFFLITSATAAVLAGYNLPFHFNGRIAPGHFPELLLIALVAEAFIYSVIFMIEYAITARRNADKEKDRADLAKFQYLNLKQQVNPHFLFNSLNILDALVLDGKDEEASTYIHKLAGIYRYMLKNENESTVTLRDEMTSVGMYCDLLKVRFQDGLNVNVSISEEDMSKSVIPCSVQLLVENATKHNSVTPELPLSIDISSDGQFITVSNNLIPRISAPLSGGLGLNYIREQYNHRSDKGIVITKVPESYTVKLPLL